MNDRLEKYGSLVARLAVAAIFIHGGWGKLGGLDGTAAYIASKGLPAPELGALLAALLELSGGLAIALGLGTRWAALALAIFLVSLTGLPPTAGFIGKLYLFAALLNHGWVWLAIVGALVWCLGRMVSILSPVLWPLAVASIVAFMPILPAARIPAPLLLDRASKPRARVPHQHRRTGAWRGV